MSQEKEVFYSHKNFTDLSKKELDLHLDFLAKVMFNLDGFQVWEAENVFSEDEEVEWDKEAIKRYKELIEIKNQLEDEIYGDF